MTPSLDALLTNTDAVAEILPECIPGLLCRLATLQHLLASRLVATTSDTSTAIPTGTTAGTTIRTSVDATNAIPEPDRLLTAEQAASFLGVTAKWLYRHARQLPFTRRLSRKTLRFSAAGLNRWLAQRGGRT